MTAYYPRCRVFLKLVLEDFGAGGRDVVHLISDPPVDECEVVRNGYDQADTFKLVLPFDWFPIDPRLIRSCGVGIYMGGAEGPDKDIVAGEGNKNLMILGHVDDGEIDHSDGSTVSLTGRDFTGLLLDEKWQAFIEGKEGKENARRPSGIDLKKPLDKVIRSILDKKLATKSLKLEFRGVASPPVLGSWHSHGEHEVSDDASFWDVIKHLVYQAGLICFVEFDTLVVTEAKTLDERGKVGGAFVYGENLKKLSLKRKLGRIRATNIRVRSYDTKKKRTLTGTYPAKPLEKVTISGTGEVTKEQSFLDFFVPNVASKAQLDKIALSIYTQRSRQQLEGSFETEDMTTLVGTKELALTALRDGSAVTIDVAADERSFLKAHSSVEERTNYLSQRGYPSRVAGVIARAFDDLDTAFYVKSATHRYSGEDGYSLNCAFLNFITGDKPK